MKVLRRSVSMTRLWSPEASANFEARDGGVKSDCALAAACVQQQSVCGFCKSCELFIATEMGTEQSVARAFLLTPSFHTGVQRGRQASPWDSSDENVEEREQGDSRLI